MRRMISLVLVVAITSGCAATTTINSVPPGATASIDGRLLGQTPVRYSDSSVFWNKHELVLAMAGYNDKRVRLEKTEVRVGPLIGALFVLVPVLWILGYPEEMTYQLESHEGKAP